MRALLIGSSIVTAAEMMAAAEKAYLQAQYSTSTSDVRDMQTETAINITQPVMSRQVNRAQKRKAEKLKARVAAKKSKAAARIEMRARKMVARK